MKTITFTDAEMDSLLLVIDYLKDSEEKHFEESAPFGLSAEEQRQYEAGSEKYGEHVYAHVMRVQSAMNRGITGA